MAAEYWVYIITNKPKGVLYTGVTNNLRRRIEEHRAKAVPGFSQKYNLHKLVFCEACTEIQVAIVREKQIKGWIRQKKIALIERDNPDWRDLAEGCEILR